MTGDKVGNLVYRDQGPSERPEPMGDSSAENPPDRCLKDRVHLNHLSTMTNYYDELFSS
jgi:hypothetical protein